VVMLWILIVMAPLAWFTAAVPFDQAKGSYAEWWKNFVCYCTVGPVITFFLWLTLAVAGAGNIAANDSGFSSASPAEIDTNASGGLTSIFEWENLTSFVIGMAMLVAGMDAAAKVCNGVKGPGFNKMLAATKGGGFINQFAGATARKYGEKGGRWAGGKLKDGSVALATGTGAAIVGGAGAAMVAKPGESKLAAFGAAFKPTRAGQAARAEGQRAFSKKAGAAGFGGIARAASMSADERQADLAKTMKEEYEKEYKGASQETKLDELERLANGKGQALEGAATKGLIMDALKDPKMREKLEATEVEVNKKDAAGKDIPLKDAAGNVIAGKFETEKTTALEVLVKQHLPDLKKQLKGTKEYDAIEDLEKGRPDLMPDVPDKSGMTPLQKINKDNVASLDPAALKSQKVLDIIVKIDSDKVKSTTQDAAGNDVYVYYNEFEMAHMGERGQKKKKVLVDKFGPPPPPPTPPAGAPARRKKRA